MSGQKIIDGLNDALAWTKATRGGTELPTKADRDFLARLHEVKIKTARDIGVLADRKQDRVRQRCRRLGWAEFVRPAVGTSGWLLTETGVVVRDTRMKRCGCCPEDIAP